MSRLIQRSFVAVVTVVISGLVLSPSVRAEEVVAAPLTEEGVPVPTTLPVEVSSGETEPPPPATEIPDCSETNQQAPVLGRLDNPQITKVEGGGTKYSFALPESAEDEYMTVNEPPQGFEPLKADDEELELWGFPPRPTNEAGMEAWRELVGGYSEAPMQQGCEGRSLPDKGYLGEDRNENWSGYEAISTNETLYRTAVGSFYQPFETSSSCGPSAAVASWVGLGGDRTGRFLQTGTEAGAGGLYNPANYSSWIEAYADDGAHHSWVVQDAFVWPNQLERAYVGYDLGSQTAYFYSINESAGQTILTEWHLPPKFYDGSTAEWIEEAPGNLPLLNYGAYMKWHGAEDQTQNYAMHALDAYNYEKDVAAKGNGVYSWPGALEGHEEFPNFFFGCR